jgi:asparagine synthase (glutamine-hydrolysing)
MAAAMVHRGPDEQSTWSCGPCALGHARLSILDLSGGRQPMTNEDGRVVVVYNGELYNHRELRKELERLGHTFRTDHSDTEVLIHGYESWGPEMLGRLNGMFAFGLWDDINQSLFLARDRYGIKPLYLHYGPGQQIIFASEIRAILGSGLVESRESGRAVLEYLTFQNIWGEETPFRDILQFPAGHWEVFSRDRRHRKRYWDYAFPRSSRLPLEEAAERHREILKQVIARQIDADVPVMTYLSGGIDSSAVVAAAFNLNREIQAYSCLFDLDGVGEDRMADEREFARAVAKHLNIGHTEMELSQDVLVDSLDKTIWALEYPMMGVSYENYLIASRVAQDAKVVLSGMGGDELHGGYLYRYQAVSGYRSQKLPLARRLLAYLRGERGSDAAREIYKKMLNFPLAEDELSQSLTPEFLACGGGFSPQEQILEYFGACPSSDLWDLIMYVDARTYLHGLLVLEDKLSMAHSLETRVPLLDNELVDYVLDLPWSRLCDGTTGKIVFRESVRPWVPDVVYKKPKMGFGPPEASWYRGKLRPWIESELSERKVRARGIFQPAYVRRVLNDHFTGKSTNVAAIWSMLSLESWCRVFNMFGGRID